MAEPEVPDDGVVLEVVIDSIRSLREHGRHVQAGLMLGEHATPPVPMEPVVMSEYAEAHPRTLARLAAVMLDDPGETTSEQARRVAESVPVVRLSKTGRYPFRPGGR